MNLAAKIEKPYNEDQELVHTAIHSIGILFGIVAIPSLIFYTAKCGREELLNAVLVYGCTFLLTFLASALFHGSRQPQEKGFFKMMDYVSIHLMIAGTYTPLHISFTEGADTLLKLIWMICIVAALVKLLLKDQFQVITIVFYPIIAVIIITAAVLRFKDIPLTVTLFLTSGILFYAAGFCCFMHRKWKDHHAAWHLLSLLGAICHFAGICLAVAA